MNLISFNAHADTQNPYSWCCIWFFYRLTFFLMYMAVNTEWKNIYNPLTWNPVRWSRKHLLSVEIPVKTVCVFMNLFFCDYVIYEIFPEIRENFMSESSSLIV